MLAVCQALSHALYINSFNPAKGLLNYALLLVSPSSLCTEQPGKGTLTVGCTICSSSQLLPLTESTTMSDKTTLPLDYFQPNDQEWQGIPLPFQWDAKLLQWVTGPRIPISPAKPSLKLCCKYPSSLLLLFSSFTDIRPHRLQQVLPTSSYSFPAIDCIGTSSTSLTLTCNVSVSGNRLFRR